MSAIKQIKLNYPDEFRIACRINNLRYEELIQYFIDHVSFYAFIGGDIEPPFLWATAVSIECKEVLNQPIETITDPRIQEISLRYIKQLTALHLDANISTGAESSKSSSLMKAWSLEMLPLTDYVMDLHTEDGHFFSLTFDFNLVCRLNGIAAELLLQYFMDGISLARERAVNVIEQIKITPAVAVLMILIGNHEEVKNRVLPQQEIYKKYGLRLLKLDKKERKESDLQTRIQAYSGFYREWYDALNQNVN
jgi:hypothetical protein